MHPLNLTALFLDGEDGQRLAEVNGLPRLGALLSSAQLRQLARQLNEIANDADQDATGLHTYAAPPYGACPSGDGSLVHPCPAHPAPVEQAGGDDRVVGWRERILAAHPNSDPGFWPDALLVEHMAAEIADLRAALAQPSTKCATCNGSGFVEFERGAVIKDCPRCHRVAQPSPVSEALIYACKNLAQITSSDGSGHADIAMAVLRMAGVGDDERERLVNEWKAARAWKPSPGQAEKAEAERPEQPKRYTADVFYHNHFSTVQMEVVRASDFDEFATQYERIVGELRADRDSWAKRWDEAVRYGARIEEQRDAALARVASLESKLAELEKQDLVDVPGPDEIHQMAFEEGQPADDGDGYLFSAEEFDLFVQRLLDSCAAHVAQAQHSVPEVSGIGRDFAYPRSVVLYLRTEPTDDDLRAIHDGLLSLAAAPGKEGL
ncbi:hypothetical protein ACSBR8_03040 [Pseudomonas aeruginosa]|uniref:hypothetical protein n=1 Tax=Pseudomonas aeruginosa TaxID=287 RepID=UPI003EBA8ED0